MAQGRAVKAGTPWWTTARAPYATDPLRSRGRRHLEPESATRTPYQRDKDRVIHTSAFRRLKQKTQVFIAHEGDNYRTRLTHTLEVSQIARSVARTLGLDEDLAEAVALAHDLGHPPFGHAGERALNACMADHGGFDHNAQTLRVLTTLEERFPDFDGLNLTWETLEGVVKHNGPLLALGGDPGGLPETLRADLAVYDLEPHTFAGPEAQVAALADDIAYNNHDIDDGWRAGLFAMEDLSDLPLVGAVFAEVRAQYPDLAPARRMAEAIRRLIGVRIADLIAETTRRAEALRPDSAEAVRAAGAPLVAFSEPMHAHEGELRRFLADRMYRHSRVNRMMSRARRIIGDLFDLFLAEPELLPDGWRAKVDAAGAPHTARIVCDYIAGMTDPFAIDEHRRLFGYDRWR